MSPLPHSTFQPHKYMNNTIVLILSSVLISSSWAQGFFVYDQQSSTDEYPWSHAGVTIQPASPFGQSFMPTLSELNFIRLNLNDFNSSNDLGATLYLNLRDVSMSGPILATSSSVSLADDFAGPVNFLFNLTVAVTPDSTYLFEIVVSSGDSWNALAGEYDYARGTPIYQGVAFSGNDVWFREGVYTIPEPSAFAIVLLGAGAFAWMRRKKKVLMSGSSKLKSHFVRAALLLTALAAQGQGSFLYDQQSSTTGANAFGGPVLQDASPYGQSFTPILASIDFVQLAFFDYQAGNSLGATIYVNLRADSITGPVLGATEPVFMSDGFGIGGFTATPTNFSFATTISLTFGAVYYLEPVVQLGDLFGISAGEYNYPGGSVFYQGVALTGSDIWFREGAVIPEPSAFAIVLLGAGVAAWMRRNRRGARQAKESLTATTESTGRE